MKLASFRTAADRVSVGVCLPSSGRDVLVDVTRAYAAYLDLFERQDRMQAMAEAIVPADMRALLEGGEASMAAARSAARHAGEVLASVAGERAWRAKGIVYDKEEVTFLPPVPRCGKIISVGANYRSHLAELDDETRNKELSEYSRNLRQATYPPAFAKFPSTMVGHDQPIVYPPWTKLLDYEAEFSIVIGKRCKNVAAQNYLDVVAGYTIMNDVSMRDIGELEQQRRLLLMGKNLDTTAPVGPFLVTKDEIPDPQNLQIRCWVNGELRQHESTSQMIFDVARIIEYYSRMTLEPGDIITTGSPAGVAMVRTPPERYMLKPGDVVEIEIDGLGRLRNQVVADERPMA